MSFRRILLAALVPLALALLAAAREPIARRLLERALAWQNFAAASIAGVELGASRLVIRGLDLGRPRSRGFRTLRATWSWGGLLEGRLDALQITGLRAVIEQTADGLQVAGRSLEGNDGAPGPALPVPRRVLLEEARLTFDLAIGRLTAEADIEARVGERPVELRLDRLALDVRSEGLTAGPAASDPLEAHLAFSGPIGSASGRLEVALPGRVAVDPGVLEDVQLQLPLVLAAGRQGIRVQLDQPGHLRVGRIETPEVVAGPLSGAIGSLADAPLLRVSGLEAWAGAARIDLQPLPFRISAEGERVDLHLIPGTLGVQAESGGDLPWRAEVALGGAGLRAPDLQLRASGISAGLKLARGDDPSLTYEIREIVSTAAPPLFAPLRGSGSASGANGTRVAYRGRIEAAAGAQLSYRGAANVETGTSRAAVSSGPIGFAPGGLQPGDLIPLLDPHLDAVSGAVEVEGEIALTEAGLEPDVSILLDDLSFTAAPGRFEGLSGVLVATQLLPPRIHTAPLLRLRRAEVGLPLSRGRLAFELLEDATIDVQQLRFALASGEVEVRPFRLRSAAMAFATEVLAERLDLQELLAALEINGLSGQGTLRGALPVHGRDGHAVIEGGVLESVGRGVLRYRPQEPLPALENGGAGAALLLQALDNFRYDELRITLDGRTDADMDVGLHLKGANPDLYDGYPIEFNLNLEGPLMALAQQGVASWTLPERIRRQIERAGAP